MAVIMTDEVRERLLFKAEGLPLGLIFSHARFSQIQYLFSSEFQAGWRSITTHRDRLLFLLLLVSCSAVALFVGPSSAILMIPTWYTDWPAAGASFWLNGNLSPSTLDNRSILNDECFEYYGNNNTLLAMNWTYASCPWAAYPYFDRIFDQPSYGASHHITYDYISFVQDLSIDWTDGFDITWALETVRTWAVASNIAIAAFSRHVSGVNWPAALWSSIGRRDLRNHYVFALQNGTKATVEADIPVVRTQCFVSAWHMVGVPDGPISTDEQYLPVSSHQHLSWVFTAENCCPQFPVIPDFTGSRQQAFFVRLSTFDGSYPATQWIDIPKTPSKTNYGPDLVNYPSALLVIRNAPWYNVNGLHTDLTCSIQADWVPGAHVTSLIGYEITTDQQGKLRHKDFSHLETWSRDRFPSGNWTTGPLPEMGPPPEFNKPPAWRHISLSPTWLNVLTPDLQPNMQGYTTMASVLEKVLSQLSAEPTAMAPWNINIDSLIFEKVNSVIVGFVADGLSRIGWDENYAYNISRSTVYNITPGHEYLYDTPGWNYGPYTWMEIWHQLLAKKAILQPTIPYRRTDGQNYTLTVTIEGYGLGLNGMAYRFSMVVLSAYLILVVYHICVVFRRDRKSHGSRRWSSIVDMLVLAQVSKPPEHALANTCTGVETHVTLKMPVRIRAVRGVTSGGEQVQLLVNDDEGRMIDSKTKYGANPDQPMPLIQMPAVQVSKTI